MSVDYDEEADVLYIALNARSATDECATTA
jgi:uncharacterized protein YuzE